MLVRAFLAQPTNSLDFNRAEIEGCYHSVCSIDFQRANEVASIQTLFLLYLIQKWSCVKSVFSRPNLKNLLGLTDYIFSRPVSKNCCVWTRRLGRTTSPMQSFATISSPYLSRTVNEFESLERTTLQISPSCERYIIPLGCFLWSYSREVTQSCSAGILLPAPTALQPTLHFIRVMCFLLQWSQHNETCVSLFDVFSALFFGHSL